MLRSTLSLVQSCCVCTGGYYDLQQHQTIINMTAGLQENDHNQLRYNQGGQQGNPLPPPSAYCIEI